MIRLLINTARSLIFSTAPPPPAVAGALAALELLQERPHRMERLRSNARSLRRALAEEGFPVGDAEMQIVPLIVGDERAAMSLCQKALEAGVFAQAIRPPTVAAGTSRLRLAAMASHTVSELRMAARVFGEAARSLGLDPETMGPPLTETHEPSSQTPVDGYLISDTDNLTAGIAAAPRSAPFDGELGADRGERPVVVRAQAPDAPFDFEREGASARAA
jgi:glycine C-acetyltransferase/8-amino-7-oxononanoate synthase